MSQGNKETKYQYKVNTNLSYGFLKDRVVNLFFSKTDMQDIILELKTLFKKNLVQFDQIGMNIEIQENIEEEKDLK